MKSIDWLRNGTFIVNLIIKMKTQFKACNNSSFNNWLANNSNSCSISHFPNGWCDVSSFSFRQIVDFLQDKLDFDRRIEFFLVEISYDGFVYRLTAPTAPWNDTVDSVTTVVADSYQTNRKHSDHAIAREEFLEGEDHVEVKGGFLSRDLGGIWFTAGGLIR